MKKGTKKGTRERERDKIITKNKSREKKDGKQNNITGKKTSVSVGYLFFFFFVIFPSIDFSSFLFNSKLKC